MQDEELTTFCLNLPNFLKSFYCIVDYADEKTREMMGPKTEQSIVYIPLSSTMSSDNGDRKKNNDMRVVFELVQYMESKECNIHKINTFDSVFFDTLLQGVDVEDHSNDRLIRETLQNEFSSIIDFDSGDSTKTNLSSTVLKEIIQSIIETRTQLGEQPFQCCAVVSFSGVNSIEKLNTIIKKNSHDSHNRMIHGQTKEDFYMLNKLFFTSSSCLSSKKNQTKKSYITRKDNQFDSTCCVIKPHIFKSYQVGNLLIDFIDLLNTQSHHHDSSLEIMDICLFQFQNIEYAHEFFNIYKDLNSPNVNYKCMIEEIVSGPCIALHVNRRHCRYSDEISNNNSASDENRSEILSVHQIIRELIVGPWNIDIAKELFPYSIRAKYGLNDVQNAIHCTDLQSQIDLELQYMFQILPSLQQHSNKISKI